jgi:hypothetical protein
MILLFIINEYIIIPKYLFFLPIYKTTINFALKFQFLLFKREKFYNLKRKAAEKEISLILFLLCFSFEMENGKKQNQIVNNPPFLQHSSN